MRLELALEVNGDPVTLSVETRRTLLDVLRFDLGLTGTKEGCASGDCGDCSVTLDGRLVCSCLVLGCEVGGRRIETIPSAVMDALVRYPWPGNVRELQNVIERAVILSPGPSLQVPLSDLQAAAEEALAPAAAAVTLADAEREHILGALRETGWVVGGPKGAAARLGMKRSTLQKKMQKLGISRPA